MSYKSFEFVASSGLSQGSVLGPLLFNIFNNDIYRCLNSETKLFVDDLKLYLRISSIDDYRNMHKRYSENSLPVNVDKCKIMSLVRRRVIDYQFNIDSKISARVCENKDLCIIFDLKWLCDYKTLFLLFDALVR